MHFTYILTPGLSDPCCDGHSCFPCARLPPHTLFSNTCLDLFLSLDINISETCSGPLPSAKITSSFCYGHYFCLGDKSEGAIVLLYYSTRPLGKILWFQEWELYHPHTSNYKSTRSLLQSSSKIFPQSHLFTLQYINCYWIELPFFHHYEQFVISALSSPAVACYNRLILLLGFPLSLTYLKNSLYFLWLCWRWIFSWFFLAVLKHILFKLAYRKLILDMDSSFHKTVIIIIIKIRGNPTYVFFFPLSPQKCSLYNIIQCFYLD